MGTYPLSFFNHRTSSPRYRGPLLVWDVDKTYLATPFSSVSGLLRIPLEFAVDKTGNPGMAEVLRGLRRGLGKKFRCTPLYFISASPPQLRRVLEHKMLKDGVEQDGLIFKDWMNCLWQGSPRRLFEQLGFKIIALLTLRLQYPLACEFLFGDDVECDAEAYETYARIIEGKLRGLRLKRFLIRRGVLPEDVQLIKDKVDKLPKNIGKVSCIFIHLEAKTPPEKFKVLGKRVVPVQGAFQLALALYSWKLLDGEAVRATYQALLNQKKLTKQEGQALMQDARRRRLVSLRAGQAVKFFELF